MAAALAGSSLSLGTFASFTRASGAEGWRPAPSQITARLPALRSSFLAKPVVAHGAELRPLLCTKRASGSTKSWTPEVCLEHLLFESGLGQRCVRCPECRGVCVWRGLRELPKNYILLRVLSSSSSTLKPTEFDSETTPRSIVISQLPIISKITRLSSYVIEHVPRMIERKLCDLGKVLWALIAMVVFLLFSFVHMVLAWATAVLGSFVFVWFSLGGVGIALFMLSTSLCYNIAQFVVELGSAQFLKQTRYREPPLVRPYS